MKEIIEQVEQCTLFGEEPAVMKLVKPKAGKNAKKGAGDKNIVRAHYYNGGVAEYRSMSVDEMFSGYDKIQIATFSINLAFVDSILDRFKEAELVIGGSFLKNSADINALIAEVYTNGKVTPKQLARYSNVCRMMESGNLDVRMDVVGTIHSKLYLLYADDGRRRVIAGSANFTYGGWDGRQIETVIIDDNPESFDGYRVEFEAMQEICTEVPFRYVEREIVDENSDIIKDSEDMLENNPVVDKVLECEVLPIVLDDNISSAPFVMQYSKNIEEFARTGREQFKKIFRSKRKPKDGIMELRAKDVESMKKVGAKVSKNKDVVVKDMPVLKIDYDERKIYYDDKELVHPEPDKIKKSIEAMYRLFDFKHFIDNNGRLRSNHYKVMNHFFCAPFMAYVFKTCQRHNMSHDAYPIASLLMSRKANSGKTAMLKAFERMITGMSIPDVQIYTKADCSVDWVRGVVSSSNSVLPIIIDDVDGGWLTRVGGEIKNIMETNGSESTPVFFISANKDTVKPGDAIQKRMTIMQYDAGIEKEIDRVAFTNTGNEIMEKLTVDLWNEYALRMVEVVTDECCKIEQGKYKGTGTYPDFLSLSSKVLLDILKEYDDAEVPAFMTEVGYTADYDRFCTDITLEELKNDYLSLGDKAFTVDVRNNIIVYHAGKGDAKKLKSYAASLPQEMKPEFRELTEEAMLEMDLKAFDEMVVKVSRSFGDRIKALFV